jgi:hypothetical protein
VIAKRVQTKRENRLGAGDGGHLVKELGVKKLAHTGHWHLHNIKRLKQRYTYLINVVFKQKNKKPHAATETRVVVRSPEAEGVRPTSNVALAILGSGYSISEKTQKQHTPSIKKPRSSTRPRQWSACWWLTHTAVSEASILAAGA